jgi:hypothetical protein
MKQFASHDEIPACEPSASAAPGFFGYTGLNPAQAGSGSLLKMAVDLFPQVAARQTIADLERFGSRARSRRPQGRFFQQA